MKVVLGEHDICQSDVRVVKFSIEKFIQHPSYKASRRLIADIMLVKLNMRVTFNQYIRPVCLPKEGKRRNIMLARVNTEARYAGRTGYVLGWGVGDSDNTSCVLRKTSLVVYKPGTCAFTAFRVFCAGYPEGKHDVCSGDSGGPFQVINAQGRYELIGIVSSGIACGDEESPGLYSDVLFALPWIYEEAYRDSMFYVKPTTSRMIRQALAVAICALLILDVAQSRKLPNVDRTCDCGRSNEDVAERIVGGILAAPHVFPWIVAIFHKGALHCGGALINDRYVLTAGHCIFKMKKKDLSLGLGIHDVQKLEEGLILPAGQLIIHEEFDSDNLHDFNDIALIKLKEPIEFTQDIKPVCLPQKGSDYTGHDVKVAGWGRVKNNGGASRYLRQASLKMMSYNTCKKTKIGNHLEKTMICAYADDTDACQGDSGGPLLFERDSGKYETIGVVSWGMGCAQRGYPGVYVKNTDYLDWIYSHTTDAIYCMDK
ncbi:transmembrane protease serine 9 [Nasonia vitripennis]|uniref:Peptidase S1 domain-containing protein n=1 Tax=Nasonia vitripennis TaxID=7425 RepID=A0A7M7QX29_NASVI|nr:transmembrane protease serine 9 [Nasonia vitripennis]